MANDIFNADLFLQGQQDGGFATSYELIPEGDYPMTCTGVDNARKVTPDGKPPFLSVDVNFEIDNSELASKLNRQALKVKMPLLLDIDPNAAGVVISKGPNKNVRLGKTLAAFGLNGSAWSWSQMIGKRVGGHLAHEVDRRDADKPLAEQRRYERVDRIAALS